MYVSWPLKGCRGTGGKLTQEGGGIWPKRLLRGLSYVTVPMTSLDWGEKTSVPSLPHPLCITLAEMLSLLLFEWVHCLMTCLQSIVTSWASHLPTALRTICYISQTCHLSHGKVASAHVLHFSGGNTSSRFACPLVSGEFQQWEVLVAGWRGRRRHGFLHATLLCFGDHLQ
jgi:hypothetical protein